MFMQRIEVPVAESPESKPAALKLIVGTIFILFSTIIMVPYLAALSLWIGAHAIAKATAKMVSLAYDSALYAGEVIVGR